MPSMSRMQCRVLLLMRRSMVCKAVHSMFHEMFHTLNSMFHMLFHILLRMMGLLSGNRRGR